MANNIEVEIKIPISRREFLKVKVLLEAKADFKGLDRVIDKYYNAPHKDFLKPKIPLEYLRVRRKDNLSEGSVAYKRAYLNKLDKVTRVDEYETNLQDVLKMERIFEVLDFKNFITIDKKRETYNFRNFEISLDQVKGLGYFIEVEAKKHMQSVEATYEKVSQFIESLGLDASKRDHNGYVLLMLKKKGLIIE